jgi:phage tail sheath protein FI
VVLVDPPLQPSLQPYTPADLVAWQAERYAALGPSAASGPLAGLISAGTDFAAAFSPWVQIVAGGTYRGDDTLIVPPSAYVAGRMARTSRERGPWIATGNVSLEDVVGLDQSLSIQDEEALQASGISPLRVALPMGATIQGVRSLSWPSRTAWGYLSTRRLFNFLRKAILPIGLSYVFEPNTPATWFALRRDLTRILRDIFLNGGLAGSKPSDAFLVQIDATLNPPSAIDAGILTALVAVAPAIPLEFLVVKLVVQDNTASVTEAPP